MPAVIDVADFATLAYVGQRRMDRGERESAGLWSELPEME